MGRVRPIHPVGLEAKLTPINWTSPSAAATEAFGCSLARQLPARVVVALVGALGSGKTTLIRGLVGALSADPVSSPTYVYHQRYALEVKSQKSKVKSGRHQQIQPPSIIDHVDLYRVHGDPTLRARSGIDELLAVVPGWLLIEWPLADLTYPPTVPRLTIEASGPPAFRFKVTAPWPLDVSRNTFMNGMSLPSSETDEGRRRRTRRYDDRGQRSLQPKVGQFSHEGYCGTRRLDRPREETR